MRRRIASVISEIPSGYSIGRIVEQELGIQASWSTSKSWTDILAGYELADVLDVVTVVYRALREGDKRFGGNASRAFLATARRIFVEQNVHYSIDDSGGVHFLADQEFEHSRASAIAALAGPRYANSLHAFEAAMKALSNASPDGKGAIRSTFAAVEGLFRLMFPSAPRLTAAEADKLLPLLQAMNVGDSPALGASSKMLASFKDWIDASHFYRHEAGSEDVAQPPISVAILLVSAGASHLRWLAEIDSCSA